MTNKPNSWRGRAARDDPATTSETLVMLGFIAVIAFTCLLGVTLTALGAMR